MNMKRFLLAVGMAVLGVFSLDAAQFLTQDKIRERLDERDLPGADG